MRRPELLESNPPKTPDHGARALPNRLAPGDRVEQFEIIRELGSGGMGVVYLARDTRLGRLVALKFVLAARAKDLGQRFMAEARTTARCNHENIVTLYDVGEHEAHLYMALEYLRGQSLRQWLYTHVPTQDCVPAQGGSSKKQDVVHVPLPIPQVLDIMVPVVRALVYAHDMELVHRDIKPENIMLTESSMVKVLDFGIARPTFALDTKNDVDPNDSILSDSFQHYTEGTSGTRPYMAPEQLSGENIDGQSDVWAVGIVMAELATGQHPMQQSLLKHANFHVPLPKMAEAHPRLDLGPLGGIIDRCLIKDKTHRTQSAKILLEELEGLMNPGRQPAMVRDEGPFAGLATFQESDADRFFGREPEVRRLVARLRTQPWLTLVGPSGSGKSSLVRAGLVPALRRSGEGWDVIIVRPGRKPMLSLAEGFSQFSNRAGPPSSPQDLAIQFQAEPGAFGVQLRQHCRTTGRRLLVFVDQFEELYTLGSSSENRRAFGACLEGAADDAASELRVIVTLRSDFMHRSIEGGGLVTTFLQSLVLLSPMRKEDLQETLTQPLHAYGYRFESSSLLDTMLRDLAAVSGVLPLLQFTAAQLWQRRNHAQQILTEQSYQELGGVAGALAAHANTVLEVMPPAHRKLARALCLQLVTPERTRALVSMDELPQGQEARSVLNRLIGARLLSVTQGPDDTGMVELVHESLIERWPRLSEWLDEDHEEALFCARLRTAAKTWNQRDRMDALLWRGPLAEEAQRWQAQWTESGQARRSLGARDIAFLDQVVTVAAQSRRRRQRVMTTVVTGLALVATIVSILAVQARRLKTQADEKAQYAAAQAEEAKSQAIRAQNATRMAIARENEMDPTLVFALVREMNPRHPPPRWRELARWARHQGVAKVVLGHPDVLHSTAFSPDGTRIATASADKLARIYNADGTGTPVPLKGHLKDVYSVVFSPDGTRIASASADNTVRIWNADGTGPPLVLQHSSPVYSAAFSPDGNRIVTAALDKTARIYNADGTGTPIVLTGHLGQVFSAAFSPDGHRIVTAALDKTAHIYNADGTGTPIVLTGHDDAVFSAKFSPDGHRIVTGSFDKTVRIWNADGTGTPIVLTGHLDRVTTVTFSPDGNRIITAAMDKTVRIWNADGTGTPVVLKAHLDNVVSTSFHPDGIHLATASWDKTVRIWDVSQIVGPVVLKGHLDRVVSASFHPDGNRIVTASWDKTARIWNTDGTGMPTVLKGHSRAVLSAAFSFDGRRIVTASWDKTARVWNANGTGAPVVLKGHLNAVSAAGFSPDGNRVVTASHDKTARIWNADGTGTPIVLKGHLDIIVSAGFSPDGNRVVTASHDKTARIWNADGTETPIVLTGHDGRSFSAAFSPDGTQIVTTSADKTARIWNANGTKTLTILQGHEGIVKAGDGTGQGAFSPDGSQVVTISADKTIRLWDPSSVRIPLIIRANDLVPHTVAFSPNGTRIVTASHNIRIPATGTQPGRIEHAVKVWSDLQRIRNLDDPVLWTTTTYCPSVEKRKKLLSLPEEIAQEQYERCLAKVAAARTSFLSRPIPDAPRGLKTPK